MPVVFIATKDNLSSKILSNMQEVKARNGKIIAIVNKTEDVNNLAYKKVIEDVKNQVAGGEKLSLALAKHPAYFSSFVRQIVKVGEETGKLDKTLKDVVNFYQKEITRSVDLFARLLEPIMIMVLGVIVALLAISVLSSIYGAIGVI